MHSIPTRQDAVQLVAWLIVQEICNILTHGDLLMQSFICLLLYFDMNCSRSCNKISHFT